MSRFKVSAPRVISCGTAPTVLVLATLRLRGVSYTYVLLSFEERSALWRMAVKVAPGLAAWFDASAGGSIPTDGGFFASSLPFRLVTHAFDPETGVAVGAPEGTADLDLGELRLPSRNASWTDAEALWVTNAYAFVAVDALSRWRAGHPPTPRSIHAPSWLALVAVRKLALAAGKPDPNAGVPS